MNIVQANLDIGGVTEVVIGGKVYALEDVKRALMLPDGWVLVAAIRALEPPFSYDTCCDLAHEKACDSAAALVAAHLKTGE